MSYWAERMAKSQNKITKKTIRQIEKQMKEYYANTLKHSIAEFEDTYNRVLLATEEGRQPTPADLYKLDKYWQMQAQINNQLERLGDKQIKLLSKQFELNFFEVYYSIGIPGAEAFNTIDNSLVQQMISQIWVADGKSWSQRIWENTQLLAQTLNEELINCVVTGAKTSDLKKKLMERFSVSYSNADMLARTELAHIQTQAAQKRYEDYGVQEVEVWADEDERRCEICGKLHKKRFPVTGAMPVPAHPRCRCCVVPVVD